MSTLVREEIELAKAEVAQKVTSIAARRRGGRRRRGVRGVRADLPAGDVAWAINAIFISGAGDLWLGFLVVFIVLLLLTAGAVPVRLAQAPGRRAHARHGDRRGQEDPRDGRDQRSGRDADGDGDADAARPRRSGPRSSRTASSSETRSSGCAARWSGSPTGARNCASIRSRCWSALPSPASCSPAESPRSAAWAAAAGAERPLPQALLSPRGAAPVRREPARRAQPRYSWMSSSDAETGTWPVVRRRSSAASARADALQRPSTTTNTPSHAIRAMKAIVPISTTGEDHARARAFGAIGGLMEVRAVQTRTPYTKTLGIPPAPNSPGPTCVPITGPISRHHERLVPEDLRAPRAASSAASAGAWMCWTIHASAPSCARDRSRSTIRSNARREVRTRSIGVISDSTVRIGLIFSAEPSQAWAPPIRPPLAQVLERVDRKPHLQSVARPPRPVGHRRRVGASASGGRGREHHQPLAAAGAGRIDHVHPLGALAELFASLLGRSHRARHPAREMDRDDVIAGVEERLVDRQEVADRGLRGGRQLRGRAEPPVVGVVVGDLALALGLARPVHVQADLWMPCSATSSAGR